MFLAGLGHESCGFTPLRTALADFGAWRDGELLAVGGVIGGALDVLREADAVPVAGMSA